MATPTQWKGPLTEIGCSGGCRVLLVHLQETHTRGVSSDVSIHHFPPNFFLICLRMISRSVYLLDGEEFAPLLLKKTLIDVLLPHSSSSSRFLSQGDVQLSQHAGFHRFSFQRNTQQIHCYVHPLPWSSLDTTTSINAWIFIVKYSIHHNILRTCNFMTCFSSSSNAWDPK